MSKSHIILLVMLGGMVSCKKELTYQLSEKGMPYHFFERSEQGKRGEIGDIYLLELQAMRPDDSVFLDTRALGRFLKFKRSQEVFPGDFHHALGMMSKGDSMVFKQIADSFYNRSFNIGLPPYVKASDELRFFVRVKDILNPYEHKMTMFEFELDQMEEFIRKKAWNVKTDSSSGIKYEITERDSSTRPIRNGDSILMKYHYTTLEGRMIARSNPDDWVGFEVGSEEHIPGLSIVLNKCRYGDKIRALIPFEQALGENGNAYVPPYTTFVVELEIKASQ